MIVDFDAQGHRETKRPKTDGDLEVIQISSKVEQTTQINKSLPTPLKQELITPLKKNTNLFAWTAVHMPGIDSNLMNHRLVVFLEA